jgi:hypothetical protein
MRLLSLLLMMLSLPAPADADGAMTTFVLGDTEIEYDPGVWRPAADGAFTCIARDCAGNPAVYAQARPLASRDKDVCAEDAVAGRAAGPIFYETPAGRLPFAAWSAWSGCRALDAPILSACAVHDGFAYRLSNVLQPGCNRAPALPAERFVELLQGVRAPK